MGKIISIFGPSGTGKTTLAVNLADALASKDKLVVIVNCDINTSSLQVFFGEVIERGIMESLADKTEQPSKFLKQLDKKTNIFLLSSPNEQMDINNVTMLERDKVENLYRKLANYVDYLIIDGTSDLVNGLTIKGIRMADYLFMVYKSTINNYMWNLSHKSTIKQLTDGRLVNIVNEHDIGCAVSDFNNAISENIDVILPDVRGAAFLENAGKTIWDERSKHTQEYRNAMEQLVNLLVM